MVKVNRLYMYDLCVMYTDFSLCDIIYLVHYYVCRMQGDHSPSSMNKYVGPPYSQTRINVAHMSRAADSAHGSPLPLG